MMVRLDAWEGNLDPPWPNDAILNGSSYPRAEELLDFRHILELCARAEERGCCELELKVGVEGKVQGRVSVVVLMRVGRVGCCGYWRRELDGEGTGEAFEGDGERDWEDGEARSGKVENDSCRDGEEDLVRVIKIELHALRIRIHRS